MKVAIFRDGPLFPCTTGGAYVINNFLEFLSKKGIDVYLFRCYRGWENIDEYKSKPYKTILLKPKDFYTNIRLLVQIIQKHKIDLLQFDSTESVCWQGKELKKITNCKIIYESHNIDSVLLQRTKANSDFVQQAKNLEIECAAIADMMLVRSKEDKESLEKIGVKGDTVQVCPTGVDPSVIHFKKERNNQNILFLGNLDYFPNRTAVGIIFDQIIKKTVELIPSAKFIITGNGGKTLEKIYKHPNAKFTGVVKDLNEIFDQVSVALCPLVEGSGTRLKILDYLSAGIPVITTRLGIEGLEEDIKKCLIVEDDFSKYPLLIHELINKHNETLSIKGLNFIKKHRSWGKKIDRFIECYDKCIVNEVEI